MAKAKKKAPAKKATPKPAAKKAAQKPAAKSGASKATAKKAAPAAKASAKKAAPVKKAASKSASQKSTASKPTAAKATAMGSASAKTAGASSKTPGNSKPVNWESFLTPLDDRLIIEIASGERMTPGGLYIPDTAADTSGNFKGTVLVAGRGHRDEKGRVRPMDVQSGDTVLFSEYSGAKLNLLGKEVLLLRESDILGIVDKK